MAGDQVNQVRASLRNEIERCVNDRVRAQLTPYNLAAGHLPVPDVDYESAINSCTSEKVTQCFEAELQKAKATPGVDTYTDTAVTTYNAVLRSCLPEGLQYVPIQNYVVQQQRMLTKKAFLVAVVSPRANNQANPVLVHQYLQDIYNQTMYARDRFQLDPHLHVGATATITMLIGTLFLMVSTAPELAADTSCSFAFASAGIVSMTVGVGALVAYVISNGESEWDRIDNLQQEALWYLAQCKKPHVAEADQTRCANWFKE